MELSADVDVRRAVCRWAGWLVAWCGMQEGHVNISEVAMNGVWAFLWLVFFWLGFWLPAADGANLGHDLLVPLRWTYGLRRRRWFVSFPSCRLARRVGSYNGR